MSWPTILQVFFLFASLFFVICAVFFLEPVPAVVSLIFLFLSISFFFILLGADFVGLVYILVYIGAVLMLFLWVVMTLPLKHNVFFNVKFSVLLFCLTLLLIFSYQFMQVIDSSTDFVLIEVSKIPNSAFRNAVIQYIVDHAETFSTPNGTNLTYVNAEVGGYMQIYGMDSSTFQLIKQYPSKKVFLVSPAKNSVLYLDLLYRFKYKFLRTYILNPYILFGRDSIYHMVGFEIGLENEFEKILRKAEFSSAARHVSAIELKRLFLKNQIFILSDRPFASFMILYDSLPIFKFFTHLQSRFFIESVPWQDLFNQPESKTTLMFLRFFQDFGWCIVLVGLLLLVSLVGAIFLSLTHKNLSEKSQKIEDQNSRDFF